MNYFEIQFIYENKIWREINKSEAKVGTWTMIYDEAMEINIGNLSFFFFFEYGESMDESSSKCDITLNGNGVLTFRISKSRKAREIQ